MSIETPSMDIVTARLAVMDEVGRLLVGKRIGGSRPELVGLWEFPGGKQDSNEVCREHPLTVTALREVQEEVGLYTEVISPFAQYKHDPLRDRPGYYVGHVALARPRAGRARLPKTVKPELADVTWVSLRTIETMIASGQFRPDTEKLVRAMKSLASPALLHMLYR